jgi:magnesium chelatase family protein
MSHQLAIVNTVAFKGIETIPIQVQVYVGNEMPGFVISGLADKAVAESKERIRSSLKCIGIGMPAKKIIVNMSPANMPKEGSHYDLPIALGILKAIGVIKSDSLDGFISIGELSLNGDIIKVPGALISSVYAASVGKNIICPASCGSEAACGGDIEIIAAENLLQIVNHFKGERLCVQPKIEKPLQQEDTVDMSDIIGNESAKRALEIAAAGGHHMLMTGSPGVGKSMLAMRLPTILPSLSIEEALEVSMIYSVSGLINNGLILKRQFREPHHNASVSAMLGGGRDCKPGEISLAHRGILFLDEITLWAPSVLNGLRESLETGYISVARVNAHIKYPARYQVIAAMNPCPCGKAYDEDVKCSKLPLCTENYINRIPGPVLDRFAINIQVNRVTPWSRSEENKSETSAVVKKRVQRARDIQKARYAKEDFSINNDMPSSNESFFLIEDNAQKSLDKIAAFKNMSNRKYFNTKRIARTIADLSQSDVITREHIMEALSYVGV